MLKTLPAIYENGVLRPLEPLALEEHQQVTVTVSSAGEDPYDDGIDHEYMEYLDSLDLSKAPSIEEVRAILSSIPGNFADDIRAERDARG